jgi:hypothetical protein
VRAYILAHFTHLRFNYDTSSLRRESTIVESATSAACTCAEGGVRGNVMRVKKKVIYPQACEICERRFRSTLNCRITLAV